MARRPDDIDPSETAEAREHSLSRQVARLRQDLAHERDAIEYLKRSVQHREAVIEALKTSTSWRISAPVRWLRHGLQALASGKALRALKVRSRRGAAVTDALAAAPGVYGAPTSADPAALFGRRVTIVAETTIAQCAKYRVWQKQQLFRALGAECEVTPWQDHAAVRNALQTAALAIFYRVPGFPEVLANIAEARRLGVPTVWEVDDLIFDEAAYRSNSNLERLTPELRRAVLDDAPLYRKALQACDYGLASTATLAAVMRGAGVADVFVVENGLDAATLEVAAEVIARRASAPARPGVTILYGSGTKTHDVDFEQAADGLEQILRDHPEVRLRIVGSLNLPAALEAFADRVDRISGVDYGSYLRLLGEADISIAPLEPGIFNDGKSNIKFLEAAILEVPSVCSPRAAFVSAIEPGTDALLAESPSDWAAALDALVRSPDLRRRIGRAAAATARRLYAPERLAEAQVRPILDRLVRAPPRAKARVLAVNIHFSPESFGGATIVAEAMAERLNARDDTEVVVLTGWPNAGPAPYDLHRYEALGLPVIAVRLPEIATVEEQYLNPSMGERFAEVLRALTPDVVHFHSIQGLSASMLEACQAEGAPYVVTLHDSWWLCERQFMVRPDQSYCHQTRIDFAVCAGCVENVGRSMRRYDRLQRLLGGAARILTPSAFHRDLHLANGLDPAKTLVNKNGVAPAGPARRVAGPNGLRLGFVGGSHPVKGLEVVRRALQGLRASNYELVLVDNTLTVGRSTVDPADWPIAGKLTVVPPYSRETMDAFFAGIDVLLFPSQWKESFGLTVREALLRDVWVIATDAGGVAEEIVEGENGTLIPLGDDPEPLRRAIADLLDNPGRLGGYVNPYKQRITSFDRQAEELGAILQAVIARKAG